MTDVHVARGVDGGQAPLLKPSAYGAPRLRTLKLARLGLINFVAWLGFASSWAPIAELFLQRACHDHGLSVEHCNSDDGGDAYDKAQQASSADYSLFGVPGGVISIFFVPVVVVVGDTWGRQFALLLPAVQAAVQSLAWLLLPASAQMTWLLATVAVSSVGGGIWAGINCVFANVADLTVDLELRQRATLFGLLESTVWLGSTAGPAIGGALASRYGVQHSFVFCSGTSLLNLLIIVGGARLLGEPIWPRTARPINWRRANPLGALSLLATSRRSIGLGATVLFTLGAATGVGAMQPFYASKAFAWDPLHIGILQTVSNASGVCGLALLLPVLLRCVHAKVVIVAAVLWNVVYACAYALLTDGWQLYGLAALNMLGGLYFPPVRASLTATFGDAHHGAALSSMGTLEQTACVPHARLLLLPNNLTLHPLPTGTPSARSSSPSCGPQPPRAPGRASARPSSSWAAPRPSASSAPCSHRLTIRASTARGAVVRRREGTWRPRPSRRDMVEAGTHWRGMRVSR